MSEYAAIEEEKKSFIQQHKKELAVGVSITTAIVLAVVAVIIAIVLYTQFMALEDKVDSVQVNTQLLLEDDNGNTESDADVEAQANIIKNGFGANNNALDSLENEGDLNAGASANIVAGIEQSERMYSRRYYTEMDDILRGM